MLIGDFNVDTSIGFVHENYSYREMVDEKPHIDDKYFMRMDSHSIKGVNLKQYIGKDLVFFKHFYEYKKGKSTYKGGYNGDPTGFMLVKKDMNTIFEGQWHFMLVPEFANNLFRPYFGYGFRLKKDKDIEETPGSYARESRYHTAQVGFESTIFDRDYLSAGLDATYKHLMRGKQISKSNESHFLDNDDIHRQKHGYGLDFSVPILVKLKEGVLGISITPYVQYWNIKKSDVNHYHPIITYEPKNKTYETGLRVAIRF